MVARTKRAHKRFFSDHRVDVVHSDLVYPATLVNCSEKGMYIMSDVSFPPDARLAVCIHLKDERLHVSARVVWSVDKGNYEGVGLALLNPSIQYTDFLINLYFGPVNYRLPSTLCS